MTPQYGNVKIPVNKTLAVLFAVLGVLIAMHFFPASVNLYIHNRFDLNLEQNVPTWFSSTLLFAVALSSMVIYVLRTSLLPRSHAWTKFWLVFAAAYLFLSMDETARLHEIIDQQYTSVKWVYVYAPFAAMFFASCVYYFVAVRNDDRTLRFWIVGGLVTYALGGLVSELVSHLVTLTPAAQQVEYVLEEGFEFTGTILVLTGCFREINSVLSSAAAERSSVVHSVEFLRQLVGVEGRAGRSGVWTASQSDAGSAEESELDAQPAMEFHSWEEVVEWSNQHGEAAGLPTDLEDSSYAAEPRKKAG